MKSTLNSLLAVLFAATLLSACSKNDESSTPADMPAPTAATAPAAPVPHEEPGGWVPPPADTTPATPATEAVPAVPPEAAPAKAE